VSGGKSKKTAKEKKELRADFSLPQLPVPPEAANKTYSCPYCKSDGISLAGVGAGEVSHVSDGIPGKKSRNKESEVWVLTPPIHCGAGPHGSS